MRPTRGQIAQAFAEVEAMLRDHGPECKLRDGSITSKCNCKMSIMGREMQTENDFVAAIRPTLCESVKKLHGEWRVSAVGQPKCDGRVTACGHCDRTARAIFAATKKSN